MYVQNTLEPSADDAHTQSGVAGSGRDLRESGLDTEFLSNLAHQLRSPLSSLRVWVDLLKDPAAVGDPADLKKLVDGIDRSASRLERQITDVLEAGYIQAGALSLKIAPVNIVDVVNEAVSSSEQPAKAREISIEIHSEANELNANADEARLVQALKALISNSIKFSPVGSSVVVEISSSRPGTAPSVENGANSTAILPSKSEVNSVFVTVSDSGPGIKPELHHDVFKPFYRTKRAGAPGGGGAGLGLAIALGLVELHMGELWVHSSAGEGAQFGFSIPVESRGQRL